MNHRFPLLSALSVTLRVVGGLLVLAGITVAIIWGISEFTSEEYQYDGKWDSAGLRIAIEMFVAGLVSVGSGESTLIFIAIEDNTRRAANALEKARTDNHSELPSEP